SQRSTDSSTPQKDQIRKRRAVRFLALETRHCDGRDRFSTPQWRNEPLEIRAVRDLRSLARAQTNRPGGPESAAAVLRQQTAPNHFGINRPGRPGHRPAENVTVCQGAEHHRFTRTESALRMPAMSERIERLFARCRDENRAGFIPYICAGDPNFARTVEIALALEKGGADLLELGVPFSDPLADGIVNQLAAQRALEAGATAHGVLDCVREIRRASEIPIVLYTYLNPIFRFGIEKFNQAAADAGVDGLLILDLPPEEDAN